MIFAEKRYDVGDCIERSGTIKQVHMRFVIVDKSQGLVDNAINEILEKIKVYDIEGENMLQPIKGDQNEFNFR